MRMNGGESYGSRTSRAMDLVKLLTRGSSARATAPRIGAVGRAAEQVLGGGSMSLAPSSFLSGLQAGMPALSRAGRGARSAKKPGSARSRPSSARSKGGRPDDTQLVFLPMCAPPVARWRERAKLSSALAAAASNSSEDAAERAEALERAVYRATSGWCAYQAKMQQLSAALRASPRLAAMRAEVLVHLDDDMLLEGTDFAREREEQRRRAEEMCALVADADIYKTDKALSVCESCGSTRVGHGQSQTRSADEGMTVFFTCLSCGHNWSIGSGT